VSFGSAARRRKHGDHSPRKSSALNSFDRVDSPKPRSIDRHMLSDMFGAFDVVERIRKHRSLAYRRDRGCSSYAR